MTEIFALALQALAPLFILICLGFGLKRWAILHHEHVPVLNLLVLNVLLPATILRALLRAPALSLDSLKLPVGMLLTEAIVLGALLLVEARIPSFRPNIGAAVLTAVFGNTAFLGYPIAQAIVPHQFPSVVMVDEFGMMVALYPVAAVLGSLYSVSKSGYGTLTESLKRFVRGPLFLALVAGIVLRLIPLPASVSDLGAAREVGRLLDQCLEYLGSATTPVVLIALGLSLEPKGGEAPPLQLVLSSTVKLLVLPAVAFAVAQVLGVHGDERTVLVLQAAMPAGVLSGVLAREYGLGGKFGVKSVFLSTCLAAATIPVVLYLLRLGPP